MTDRQLVVGGCSESDFDDPKALPVDARIRCHVVPVVLSRLQGQVGGVVR